MLSMLILLGVLLLVLAFSVTRSARRQRARMEEAERRRRELAERGGDPGFSPFAGMPFGGLFDALLSGGGGWSRSLEYDPETGRWVDVSDRAGAPSEPPLEGTGTEREGGANGAATAPPQGRRQSRQATSPFGGLFGGMMESMGGMGGGGDFEVEPPEELEDFSDVGG